MMTSLRWKLKVKNFGPNVKSVKFLGSGVKTRVSRVSGNNKNFLGLTVVGWFTDLHCTAGRVTTGVVWYSRFIDQSSSDHCSSKF